MEMTNETKAKIIGETLFSKIQYKDPQGDIVTGVLSGIKRILLPLPRKYMAIVYWNGISIEVDISDIKLIRKPLSSISYEDAIEVAKIAMRRHNRHYAESEISYKINEIRKQSDKSIFFAEIWLLINKYPSYLVRLEKGDVCTSQLRLREKNEFIQTKDFFTPNTFEIYQYLISKGYDLPNYHLGGKTLFEAGLATYSE